MTSFLIDSNVASETVKPLGDANVLRFLTDNLEDIWLPTVVIYEVLYGVENMPRGRRRDDFQTNYDDLFAVFEARTVPFDEESARWAARFRSMAERAGRNIRWADPMIAGTARTHGLTVATRNMRDFEVIGVNAINPWDSPLSP